MKDARMKDQKEFKLQQELKEIRENDSRSKSVEILKKNINSNLALLKECEMNS